MLKQVPALAKEWLSLIKLITICAKGCNAYAFLSGFGLERGFKVRFDHQVTTEKILYILYYIISFLAHLISVPKVINLFLKTCNSDGLCSVPKAL